MASVHAAKTLLGAASAAASPAKHDAEERKQQLQQASPLAEEKESTADRFAPPPTAASSLVRMPSLQASPAIYSVAFDVRPNADGVSAAAAAPSARYGLDLEEEDSALLHSKLDSIASFYNELLNDNLKRQYEFFMEKAAELATEDEQQRSQMEPALAAQAQQLQDECATLLSSLSDLDASNKSLGSSVREWSARVSKLSEENAFLKDLNSNLLADQMARKRKEKEDSAANTASAAAAAQAASAAAAASPAASTAAAATAPSASPPAPSASAALALPTAALPASSSAALCLPAAALSSAASSAASSSDAAAPSSASPSPSPLLDLDPALVSRYARLREEKAKRIAALEKEVSRLMAEMEAKTKREQQAQQQAERERLERVARAQGKPGARGRK